MSKELCTPGQRNCIKKVARFNFEWAESTIYEKILECTGCALPEGIEELKDGRDKTNMLIESLSKGDAHVVIAKLMKLEDRNKQKPYVSKYPAKKVLRSGIRSGCEIIF